MASCFLYLSKTPKKKCHCGVPPYADGVPCDACEAYFLEEAVIKTVERLEEAYVSDKSDQERFTSPKRKAKRSKRLGNIR